MKRLLDLRTMAADINEHLVELWPYWDDDSKGCFLGHAAHYEPFTLQGFSYEDTLKDDKGVLEPGSVAFICKEKWGEELYEGFEAAMVFFGLDRREALYLFGDSSYNVPHLRPLSPREVKAEFLKRLDGIITLRKAGQYAQGF